MQIGVSTADVADVALEVLDIYCVKADDGREEANVLLCQTVTEVVGTAGLCEVCFGTVQRLEELGDSLLIRFLGSKRDLVQAK